MRTERHPLTLQIQDIFLASHLSPDLNFLLIEGIDDYFKNSTLAISDDLPRLVKKLYSIDDNKIYTIISVCSQDQYQAVLLTPLLSFINHSSKNAITFLKQSGELSGHALADAIKDVNDLMKIALELLRDSTLSSRRAIGDKPVEDIEYPDYETLKSFYECGRKVKYSSYEEAESNLDAVNSVYLCPLCSQYHQGQSTARKSPPIPEDIKLIRYKKIWRRYHKI